ncbi:MAG TPA: toll/interleukin-1 receptor domain-containing protein, partial [Chitinophagaceae bacterium]|nr:toll/interleukin-1 receptor domain-containing protein [Chitinophagaceae bacterium]
MKYKVFISHAGIDTWVARQIEFHIEKCGASTFLDAANIDVGDQFENILEGELKASKELIVLFTPWSMERPYVWLEVGAAWILKKRIVVVLYGL